MGQTFEGNFQGKGLKIAIINSRFNSLFTEKLLAGAQDALIRHQVKMGDLLRQELKKSGWNVVNQTKLPVVCFVDQQKPVGKSIEFLEHIAQGVVSSGKAWISTTRLKQNIPVLRACITNYRTGPEEIYALVRVLNETRQDYRKPS